MFESLVEICTVVAKNRRTYFPMLKLFRDFGKTISKRGRLEGGLSFAAVSDPSHQPSPSAFSCFVLERVPAKS